MKRLLTLVIGILLIVGSASAQGKFGIKGGLNYDSFNPTISSFGDQIKTATGFHAGFLYRIKVPFIGLAIQPELLYSQKNTEVFAEQNVTDDLSLGYLEVPLNLQMGIDLIFLRPYVQITPYVSYAIMKGGSLFNEIPWDDINRFDYGLGLGAGIELWKLQVSGKYNWSLNSFTESGEIQNLIGAPKFKGFQLSVAFLF